MTAPARAVGGRAFAARARRERLRRVLTALGLTCICALIGLGIWLVGWSHALAITHVNVEGVRPDRTSAVMAAAQAPIGVPLARVDTDAVAQRVRVLADVAKVEVHRSWPHTLTIEVTPRVPAAVINVRESWWNVDRDGVLFGTSTTQPASLPVLEAPTDKADTATRAAGVAVLTALPAAVTELIQTVEAKSEADIELTLTDGAVVHWGTADRTQRKAEVLLALIETQTQPPTGYDVSAPDRPAITP